MAILFDGKNKVFYLNTPNSTYAMGVFGDALISHMYWGKPIRNFPKADVLAPHSEEPCSAMDAWLPESISSELVQLEYGVEGGTDRRYPALEITLNGRSAIPQLKYIKHDIFKGKKSLEGLPATYVENDDEADTLEITLVDSLSGVEVVLSYTIFADRDVITRNVRIKNNNENPVQIKKALSACLDIEDSEFDILHLPGAVRRECNVERIPLTRGNMLFSSSRGVSSHMQNPFLALLRKNTSEHAGECFGFSLIYSGEFELGVEYNHVNNTRAYIGINPRHFDWKLNCGETFQTPEAVLVYSDKGIGGMSRIYHDLYRSRLCRGKYRDIERPILINNWEATYFDFNEEKILNIANKAKEIGVELMVLDDGWFGKRNDDHSSLGDWVADRNKLPDGVGALSEKVDATGMKFGLWFEPEMVSPDSDLHRAHPDWHIHIPGYEASYGRFQWILDLSREDVQDYVIDAVSKVLGPSKISYIKWDMNRYMAELGSAELPPERTGELCHRYVLGLYRIMDELTKAFPDILFEGCSGGGGRFDPGILYYMPQIWTSDSTDGVERLYIQYGVSTVYPTSTMGAHISAVPNHQVGRTTPIKLRAEVALMGQFGFELDLSKLSQEDLNEAKEQVEKYKEIRSIIHYGEMYRLVSPFNCDDAAFNFVSKDGQKVVVCLYCLRGKPNAVRKWIKLEGLDENADYLDVESGTVYGGDLLMRSGIPWVSSADYISKIMILEKI